MRDFLFIFKIPKTKKEAKIWREKKRFQALVLFLIYNLINLLFFKWVYHNIVYFLTVIFFMASIFVNELTPQLTQLHNVMVEKTSQLYTTIRDIYV